MPVRPSRRIFRSHSSRRRRARQGHRIAPGLAAGLLGTTLVGVVLMLSMPAKLFGRVPVLSGQVAADALDVQVIDGQTLRLGTTLVRLADVVAPARGDQCGRRNDCGVAAVEALAEVVRGHALRCTLAGRDSQGFAQAACNAAGADVATALVTAGWARPSSADAGLQAAAEAARAARRGVWDSPT